MTIRDIAEAAHVSVATVSKIINHKDAEISDKTRQKVLKVIKEYQYTPYANFKALGNTSKSQTIAYIAQEGTSSTNYIMEVEKETAGLGYSLIIRNITKPYIDNIKKTVKIMEARKVEGILWGLASPDLLEEALRQNFSHIPMAAISTYSSENCTTFQFDYKSVTEKAVLELLKLGHQKIGCILDNRDALCAKACIEGYKSALSSVPQFVTNYYIVSRTQLKQELLEEMQALLQAKVTAVFCQTALLANAVYEILKEGKYYIPNNISVICGEASPHAKYFIPPLTSYTPPKDKIISSAVEYLINCIESRLPYHVKSYVYDPYLLQGESIASPVSIGKQILVIGNCNTDVNIHLNKMPVGGELLHTNNITMIPGGKAVSQAICAGKLGGSVYILGCVGNDAEGNNILNSLKETYVHTEGLCVLSSLPTGKAYIFVPDSGNSSVISYPGTNSAYTVSLMRPFKHFFETSDYCLISTELNIDLITYAIKKCEKCGTSVFVKPSSISAFPEELFSKITYFVPNVYELNSIIPGDASFEEKADYIFKKGCKNVIVTLGGKGCYLKNQEFSLHIPAADFNVVDTTGAANCFIASMAVSLSNGNPLLYAISYATYAAGISVTQPGVQTSFPDKRQLEIYLDEIQDMYQSIEKIKPLPHDLPLL